MRREPPRFATLIEMIEFQARDNGQAVAFDFAGQEFTFAELWRKVETFAQVLVENGVEHGDRVVLPMPNGPGFFVGFYGVQRAGAIAVPLFPNFGAQQILSYANLADASLIVMPADFPADKLAELQKESLGNGRKLLSIAEEPTGKNPLPMPEIKEDDVAFIQFTSGTTGVSKGVLISHDNLLNNITQMIAGMKITGEDVFVSWLPVYHDMGLILMTMVPFYLGLKLYLLPANLRDPSLWLKTIQAQRATYTAAPDFAYRLCLRRIANPQDFDLSSLRIALNAAEPVRGATIEQFETAFRLQNVVTPAYGLAEATVGVSIWPPGNPIKIDQQGNVSIGKPFPDIDIVIVVDGQSAEPGTIGEIAIKSAALPRGYYCNREATEALFWRDQYILSGDMGYSDADGDLFIVGRRKNTIIQAGRTLFPAEIEAIVDRDPAVRYNMCVGIESKGAEGEQAFVFAELQNDVSRDETNLQNIIIRIVASLYQDLGIRPGRTVLLEPKAIPMTHNGKFQHQRLKRSYELGQLQQSGQVVFPR